MTHVEYRRREIGWRSSFAELTGQPDAKRSEQLRGYVEERKRTRVTESTADARSGPRSSLVRLLSSQCFFVDDFLNLRARTDVVDSIRQPF
jgi:hypothetical protein